MPTHEINNSAGEGLPDDARDDLTAAAVVGDDQPGATPGGGGLGGAAAGGQPGAPAGIAPNSPIDVPLPTGSEDAGTPPSADAQARREAVDNASPEQHPVSQ
jgi:hypothetical protein